MKIQDNSKLIFIGDSISDFERARPCGEGLFGGIGKSYVGLVDGLLWTSTPTGWASSSASTTCGGSSTAPS